MRQAGTSSPELPARNGSPALDEDDDATDLEPDSVPLKDEQSVPKGSSQNLVN